LNERHPHGIIQERAERADRQHDREYDERRQQRIFDQVLTVLSVNQSGASVKDASHETPPEQRFAGRAAFCPLPR
jgi:hypothetical protein